MQRPTFAYLESLERSQWLTRGEIERLQTEKLKTLLQLAVRHSPWHADRIRAAGMDVENPSREITLDDLRRLPTMTKQDARANVERIHWAGAPGGTFRYNTGGSSGEPLIFYYGRQRQASDAAGRMRARRWWGVDVGDREVYLWGAPVELEQDGSHQDDPRPPAQPVGAQRVRDVRGQHGRLSGRGAGVPAQVHLRLREQRRTARGTRERTKDPASVARTARGLHDRRAALSASAHADRAGVRRPGRQRIRQPRHRIHRARDAAAARSC